MTNSETALDLLSEIREQRAAIKARFEEEILPDILAECSPDGAETDIELLDELLAKWRERLAKLKEQEARATLYVALTSYERN